MEPDFSGWATKFDVECSDGRTIAPEAFKHMDGKKVPLVWSHDHKEPDNLLGHGFLTWKPLGMWIDGYFNDNPRAKTTKHAVQHGDIDSLSIWANRLREVTSRVVHGAIREVSLVLAGANDEAKIINVQLAHSFDDGYDELEDEAIITGLGSISHGDEEDAGEKTETEVEVEVESTKSEGDEEAKSEDEEASPEGEESEDTVEHADDDTLQEIYDSMSPEQKKLMAHAVAVALNEGSSDEAEHSDENTDEGTLEHKEGTEVNHNIFENESGGTSTQTKRRLSHDEMKELADLSKRSGKLSHGILAFAEKHGGVDELKHGIENLELLFPEARAVSNTPEWDKRRTEWVSGVLNGVKKTPYSRIKSLVADITQEEARARGYIKGNLKKEEWFGLTRRTTSPTTIYKKQKLDRDDVIDIVDLDVVAWMRGEMRLMLEEEIARAILIGDGRPVEDPENPGEPNPDKIKDPAGATDGAGIRSILNDDELYSVTVTVPLPDAGESYQNVVERVMLNMEFYKGSGSPTFYTTQRTLTRMLLSKDGFGRRLWRTKAELADEMGVSNIVPVEVFGDVPDLLGIIVNLSDYNVGTDKGGEVTWYDDFDIDYNQLKWLIETRLSGALIKIRSAIVLRTTADENAEVVPLELAFDPETNTIDYVAQTGVIYSLTPNGAALAADEVITEDTTVYARPDAGYYFNDNQNDSWTYEFNPDA